MAKEDLQKLSVILLIQAFLLRASYVEQRSHVFFIILLYIVIMIFFGNQFSVKAMIEQIRSGKQFWIATGITFVAEAIFVGITHLLNGTLLADKNVGMLSIVTSSDFDLLLYYLVLMIIEPIALTVFYRKLLISFKSPVTTIITGLLSILLICLLKATGIIGIIEIFILCIPITVLYILNKNIYVSIIAMYGVTILVNIASLAKIIGRIVLR